MIDIAAKLSRLAINNGFRPLDCDYHAAGLVLAAHVALRIFLAVLDHFTLLIGQTRH